MAWAHRTHHRHKTHRKHTTHHTRRHVTRLHHARRHVTHRTHRRSHRAMAATLAKQRRLSHLKAVRATRHPGPPKVSYYGSRSHTKFHGKGIQRRKHRYHRSRVVRLYGKRLKGR